MSLPPSVESLLPVLLLIAAGYGLKRSGKIGTDHWRGVERLTYLVLFPATILTATAQADLSSVPFLTVSLALVGAILASALTLMLLRRPFERHFGISGASFSSMFQGSVRWNSPVAYTLAVSLYGARGAALAAVAIATMIPLVNFLSVSVLARYASGVRPNWREWLMTLLKNPFIWSCIIGIGLRPVVEFIPKPLITSVSMAGSAALATSLLVVGAGLEIARLKRLTLGTGIPAILKLGLMPIVASVIGHAFGLSNTDLSIVLLATAVPTASAAYILARQMGGDSELMADILTFQTGLAMITLPVVLAILV
jgi:malonate transporter